MSTVAQYRDTEYAASLEAFDKRIVADVQKGLTPERVAGWVLQSSFPPHKPTSVSNHPTPQITPCCACWLLTANFLVLSRTIVNALTAKAPRARYIVVAQPLFEWLLPMWLPARWFDVLLAKIFLVKS